MLGRTRFELSTFCCLKALVGQCIFFNRLPTLAIPSNGRVRIQTKVGLLRVLDEHWLELKP